MTTHVETNDQHQRDIGPIAASRIVDTVVKQCGDRLPVETAERLVAEELRRFSDAPVHARTFLRAFSFGHVRQLEAVNDVVRQCA